MPEWRLDGVVITQQFRIQPLKTISVTDPVVDTWYPILEVDDSLILYFETGHDEGANKRNEARFTGDGTTFTSGNILGQRGDWYLKPMTDTLAHHIYDGASWTLIGTSVPLYFHSILFEMRVTEALTAGKILDGKVRYETLI